MTHGVCGYVHHGCRCVECTRAQRDRMRAYRAAKRTSGTLDTTGGSNVAPRDAGTSGGLAPNSGGSMQGQRYTQPAWLGYLDGQLVAIELEGFHAGETIAEWESRGYRVEQVSNTEAKARWRSEVQEAAA